MASELQRIGPYRIERQLGAGGMGEVYLAYDEHLERRVAVKYIRPDNAGRPEARQRFRREAKAAAALSHPATVQIFHVLETPSGDAIVMEYIQGETLAKILGRGRLPLHRALRLTREITAGLAAAHAHGILHRDLKPENVMVTAEGHAKILDFGLAKSLEPHPDEALSQADVVLGTYAAMSPEQARGQDLDARSDLFSLGLLCYRMFTGRHPFVGKDPVDTLTLICTEQQLPAHQVDPRVPPALSTLVDRLLEKDPPRRPDDARAVLAQLKQISVQVQPGEGDSDSGVRVLPEVGDTAQQWALEQPTWDENQPTLHYSTTSTTKIVRRDLELGSASSGRQHASGRRFVLGLWLAALAAVAVSLAWWLWWSGGGQTPTYVAVLPPTVTSASAADKAEMLASSLELALMRNLMGRERLAVLPAEQIEDVSGSPVEIARATAADELFLSTLECRSESCNLVLRRVSGHDGSLLWTERLAVLRDRPYALQEVLGGYVDSAFAAYPKRTQQQPLVVSEEDYETFLSLYSDFALDGKTQLTRAEVVRRLAEIRQRSPAFLEAYLFAAQTHAYSFKQSRDAVELQQALELLDQASELAPNDVRSWLIRVDVALAGGQVDVARQALTELEKLQPGDVQTLVRRADLQIYQGHDEEAMQLMRRVVEQHDSRANLFRLASLELHQGLTVEARGHLEQLLERAPDYSPAMSLLAQLELVGGSLERAALLYEELVRQSPQVTELNNLSIVNMLRGRWDEAAKHARHALRLESKNPFTMLNLADALTQLDRHDEAQSYYRQVLEAIEQDPASEHWQMLTVKAQALAHLGRSEAAVKTIETALDRAPDGLQVATEAALVYSLVERREEARDHALRALETLDGRWFSLPWFDDLRRDEQVAAALER